MVNISVHLNMYRGAWDLVLVPRLILNDNP